MARFILRYNGEAASEEQAAEAAAAPNVKIIDRSPKMMLIEADERDAKDLADRLSGWTLHPERQYQIPDARVRIINDAD